MRAKKGAAAFALALVLSLPAAAQEGLPHILGIDLVVGTPSSVQDVFRSVTVGASVRWLMSYNVELSLDYFFLGTEYYYPDPDSGDWVGPVPWTSVPQNWGVDASDWIFYHTRHYLAPKAWLLIPSEPYGGFAARFGTGPALSFVVPSEAATYYPELADAFAEFETTFEAYLGWTLDAGLEWRPMKLLAVGFEYLFVADDLRTILASFARDWLGYLDRSGNLVIYLGVRI
ncbi:MAG: hypothetical protein NT080_01375 [Spirochaetes bacterium]|nr:hypothetical protein [Spirochaetota bacterium]